MSTPDNPASSGRFAWLRAGGSTVAGGATILMVSYVLSRVLGLGREVAVSARFGTSGELAAYVAAFRLPDLAFLLFAGGALSSAYIPLYREMLARNDAATARAFASSVLNGLIIVLALFVAVIILLAPWVVPLISPGFDAADRELTVALISIVAFSPLFLAVSEVLTATLHARQHFLLPAFAPLLYSLAGIAGAVVLAIWWGIYGLAIGVVIGAVLHVIVQIPAFRTLGPGYAPVLHLHLPELKRLVQLTVPRMAGLLAVHLSLIFIMINLASRLGANVVVAMNYAWVLMMLPLGVFGMAVARAWFPQFAAAAMDGPTPELARQLTAAIRTVLFFLLPAAAGLMLFAPLVVATLFERGAFDAASTDLTAWALLFFAVGLAGHGAVEVLNRGFFALKDTRTPVVIGIVSMGLGIALAWLLMRPLAQGGLALGISLAVLLEAIWLWLLLARRVPNFRFLGGMLPLLLCTLIAAGASGALQWLAPLAGTPAIVRLVLYGAVLLGVYILSALLLGAPEARTVWQRLPMMRRKERDLCERSLAGVPRGEGRDSCRILAKFTCTLPLLLETQIPPILLKEFDPLAARSQTTDSGPVSEHARITSLDLIRGVAVLGILLMNAVSFKFVEAAYYNISADGSETWLDWAAGIFGEIFIDQKFMGMFSLLFGAGMILFIDRAAQRGRRAVLLNLWRNILLLAIGIAHFMLWYGDVLMIYALSAFILIPLRNLPNKALLTIGVAVFMLSVVSDLYGQALVNAGAQLGGVWTTTEAEDETLGYLSWLSYIVRGPGMVLIGAALYRMGFTDGSKSVETYRMTATIGLGVGLALAALGVVITALGDYSRDVALIGQVPNSLGTIPASLGFMSLVILWNNGADNWLKRRLRAVGRMALTNYLMQTILGVLTLTLLLGDVDSVNRSGVLVFVFAVWALQVWWSQAWLSRFLFGPAEWLWRVATYRSLQPLRRPRDSRGAA